MLRFSWLFMVLSATFWAWVRLRDAGPFSLKKQLVIGGVFCLMWGCFGVAWRSQTRVGRWAAGILHALVVCWLLSMYVTSGETVFYVYDRLPFATLLRVLLVASATASLMMVLATVNRWMKASPDLFRRVAVAVCGILIVFAGIDLWFVISPAFDPLVVSGTLYRKQYHPIYTYAEPGAFMTVDAREREVRDYWGRPFLQTKPAGVTRVILAGASTVYGHGLKLEDTLTHRLQAALRRDAPERKFEVICLAFPGKTQLNELVDCATLVPRWQPDLVVSMNGFNEVWYSEQPGLYLGQPYIEEQAKFSFGDVLLAKTSHLWPVVLGMNIEPPPGPVTELEPGKPHAYGYLDTNAKLLKLLGIRYAFAFCPTVFELEHPSPSDQAWQKGGTELASGGEGSRETVVKQRRVELREIVERQQQRSFPVMEWMQDFSGDLFVDECHLTAGATEQLAERLAREIPRWIDE